MESLTDRQIDSQKVPKKNVLKQASQNKLVCVCVRTQKPEKKICTRKKKQRIASRILLFFFLWFLPPGAFMFVCGRFFISGFQRPNKPLPTLIVPRPLRCVMGARAASGRPGPPGWWPGAALGPEFIGRIPLPPHR